MAAPDSPQPAGRVTAYGVLGVLPALVCAAWIAAGVGLLLAHAFHPWLAVPAALVLLAAMVAAVPFRQWTAPAGPRWALLLTLAVVVAATVWAVLHSSENLIVRRDPGPYGLIGSWIARHGTMSIPTDATVFGHLPNVAYGSPAFYGKAHDLIQPQFMSGLPLTIAPASWIGGLSLLLKANAVIGGVALLSFAAFVARAVGPRAVPFATAVLALAYPETHAFRSAYSEPLTQLMVFGGLCLLWDAGRRRERSSRAVALAGIVLGLTVAVRIDALADLLPLAGVVIVYAVGRRGRDAAALAGGVLLGAGVGLLDAWALHNAYLHDTSAQLRQVALGALAAAVVVAIAIPVGRRLAARGTWLGLSESVRRRLGLLGAAAIPVVTVLAYAVRPYLSKPRSKPGDHTADEVGRLQALQHLTIDPHRTYAEQSMHWLAWWVGVPAILLAALAAGLVVRRWLSGRDAALLPVVATGLSVAFLVLWRPSITPDHPWADRRIVPLVLPVLVLLATWLLALVAERRRWVAAVLALAVLVPTVVGTAPLAWSRTEDGQLAAVQAVCRAIPAGSAVLFVDAELAYRWSPAVRDECGVPTGYVSAGTAVSIPAVQQVVRAAGRTTLVLLAANAAELTGREPRHTVGLTYRVDARTLTRRPKGTDTERTDVWAADVALP